MWKAGKWEDYALLDTSDGKRLERWGRYVLCRPDPQVIWKNVKESPMWKKADAVYEREGGGGKWQKRDVPECWTIGYGDLRFKIKPMGFKHTGLFPEQAVNWDWFSALIKNAKRPIKVLNLFAYTGGATVAAAAAGASVCHVDAAKGMVAWARENARLSGLADAPIRWIVDDCAKFVEREIRRGKTYDAIIMDPPSYGRGPSGEIWKMETSFFPFLQETAKLLTDNPLFVIINSYTTGLAPSAVAYAADVTFKPFGGKTAAGELGLPVRDSGLVLPCGATGRWTP